MVQLSHPHMTTEKTIVMTIRTFVGKVMSLFFNMLSRFAIAFSSKEQASFNFMAAVTVLGDFGAQGEKKICHCFHRKIPQAPLGEHMSWQCGHPENTGITPMYPSSSQSSKH